MWALQKLWTNALPYHPAIVQEKSLTCKWCKRFNCMRNHNGSPIRHEWGFEAVLYYVLRSQCIHSTDDIIKQDE